MSDTRYVRFRFPSDDILDAPALTPDEKLAMLKSFADEQTVLALQRATVLEQVAQQVHQAYHTDQRGTWRECPEDVCEWVHRVLSEELS